MNHLPLFLLVGLLSVPTLTQAMANASATASSGIGAHASANAHVDSVYAHSSATAGTVPPNQHCWAPAPAEQGWSLLIAQCRSLHAPVSVANHVHTHSGTTSSATATTGIGAHASATAHAGASAQTPLAQTPPTTASTTSTTRSSVSTAQASATPSSGSSVNSDTANEATDDVPAAVAQAMESDRQTEVIVATEHSARRERLGLFLLALNTILLIGVLALQLRSSRVVSAQRF